MLAEKRSTYFVIFTFLVTVTKTFTAKRAVKVRQSKKKQTQQGKARYPVVTRTLPRPIGFPTLCHSLTARPAVKLYQIAPITALLAQTIGAAQPRS